MILDAYGRPATVFFHSAALRMAMEPLDGFGSAQRVSALVAPDGRPLREALDDEVKHRGYRIGDTIRIKLPDHYLGVKVLNP